MSALGLCKMRRAGLASSRPPAQPEIEDPLEQGSLFHTRTLCRIGKVLAIGKLRIGICFEHIDLARSIEPQIDAGVAAHAQCAVDAAADMPDVVPSHRDFNKDA